MTIKELYALCSRELSFGRRGDFEALCIFEDLLSLSRSQILISNEEADSGQFETVKNVVERRKSGEPLQYILGKWDFYDMSFFVGEGVLIPRPETEMLVDFALEKLESIENPVVYDICAGTGCIGLTVANRIKNSQVFLFEKEEKAFRYLQKNKEKYSLSNVTLINCDIFDYNFSDLPKADMILSNPPYIKSSEIKELQREVLSEPHTALDGGEDGLMFYRCILDKWISNLKSSGYIAFECGENQSEDIISVINGKYSEKNVIFDFNDIDRIVTFRI